ncbi:hypothetical protein DTW90_36510 [Neorhizobium sp. P12A]|nr:hypothetical protein DTW90_36510 [Neorhizobium sp. P12A]
MRVAPMKYTSIIRQAGKIVSLSLAISTASLLTSAGAQAAEPHVLNIPVTLIDFTCGDGMHFDYKQGCVIDAPKLKKEVTRAREDRRIRPSGDPSKARQTTQTEI